MLASLLASTHNAAYYRAGKKCRFCFQISWLFKKEKAATFAFVYIGCDSVSVGKWAVSCA